MAYNYKGKRIDDLIAHSGTTTHPNYGIKYNTTTNPYDKINYGFIDKYQVSSNPISNSIQARKYVISDNTNLSLPSWTDAFRIHAISKACPPGPANNSIQGWTNFGPQGPVNFTNYN